MLNAGTKQQDTILITSGRYYNETRNIDHRPQDDLKFH